MKEKKLGVFDVLMLLLTGLLFCDAVAPNTSAGVPNLTWWIITGTLYMIPTGLIIGELSSVYPDEGGIYVWIREGLGAKTAAWTSWLFFCCGLFIPVSMFILCSDILFTMFLPSAGYAVRVAAAIVLIWVMAGISCLPMSEAKWITNVAGIIKLLFFVCALIAGIVYLAKGNPIANEINASTLRPTFSQGLTFLPVILYSCTGMELASASAQEMRNPGKNLPRVIVAAAVMAVFLNLIADTGMLMVIPVDSINLDLGMIDLFSIAFDSPAVTTIVSLAFIFVGLVQSVTWQIGGNRGTCESAKIGDLPAVFGKENAAGQPIGAILISSALATAFVILYAFIGNSAPDLFFSLMNCGVLATVVPYVLMLASYQKLKRAGKLEGAGFRVPGGLVFSWISQIIQVFALLLMIYIPTVGWNENVITNVLGLAFMTISALILYRHMHRGPAPAQN